MSTKCGSHKLMFLNPENIRKENLKESHSTELSRKVLIIARNQNQKMKNLLFTIEELRINLLKKLSLKLREDNNYQKSLIEFNKHKLEQFLGYLFEPKDIESNGKICMETGQFLIKEL